MSKWSHHGWRFHTAWYGRCWWGEIAVVKILESWLVGACSNNLLHLYFPASQKSATLELLNLLLLVVKCANGPLPNQLSHQNKQFPACNFCWMCCSICGLFINIYFQVKESPEFHFLLIGLYLWQYFAFKKAPHRVCLVIKFHHCLNWKDLQISFKFLMPIPPSS